MAKSIQFASISRLYPPLLPDGDTDLEGRVDKFKAHGAASQAAKDKRAAAAPKLLAVPPPEAAKECG